MTDLTSLQPSTASRPPRRRVRVAVATVLTALAATVLAAPAHAGECSKQTKGDNDRVMWTGKGFTCAYVANSGKKKIGAWKTHTWTSSTALGYTKKDHRWKHTGGVKISYIYLPNDLGSSITFTAWNSEDGSRHWGANVIWQTSKAGSVSSNQYKGDSYDYKANRFYVSKISVSGATTATAGAAVPYTVKVTDPDGGSKPAGSVVLFRQVGSKPQPPSTGCDGKSTNGQSGYDVAIGQAAVSNGAATLAAPPSLPPGAHQLYAVYTGSTTSKGLPLYCAGPANDGLTGAQAKAWTLTVGAPGSTRSTPFAATTRSTSATARSVSDALSGADDTVTPDFDPSALAPGSGPDAGVQPFAVVQGRFVVRRDGTSAAQKLACPAGHATLQLNAASPTAVLPEGATEDGSRGVRIRKNAVPAGTTIDVQRVCRPRAARVAEVGNVVLGTPRRDRLVTRRDNTTVLAGTGDDTVRVRTSGSVVFGFTGNDTIVLTTARGAADGGPGNDRIEARAGGDVLLVGGPGRDTLIGAKGKTLINAVDGGGGDRVVCRSKQNLVMADKGDTLVGPCTVVHR